MSTTTEILFNSPALHSLKREQLVKLCKIHSIKASGKNVELIERLKQRAQELPPGAMSDPDEDNHGMTDDTDEVMYDANDSSYMGSQMPRPSEQWEIVMEGIEEECEANGTASSKGTLRSMNGTTGEFGSRNSKITTVGSSIKALATSFGIKRAPTTKSTMTSGQEQVADPSRTKASLLNDPLTRHAVPYSSLPPASSLPETDHFTFSTPDATFLQVPAGTDGDTSLSEPIPGNPSRPGVPAPADARLSMGAGLTTTIRLITPVSQDFLSPPRLEPYHTTFDIDMGTPQQGNGAGHHMPVWPASPGVSGERLYPALPTFEAPSLGPSIRGATEVASMPGALSNEPVPSASLGAATRAVARTPAKNSGSAKKETPKLADGLDIFSPMPNSRRSVVQAAPFLFGSPLPQNNLSNKEFGDAATSVLEEMNRRLAAAGVIKVDEKVAGKNFNAGGPPDIFGTVTNIKDGSRAAEDRFAKAHENAFNKMDSIATHYAAKRGQPQSKKRKSDVLGVGHAPGAKRQNGAAGARVISNGVRKKMGVPGAFGNEDNDDDNDDEEEDAGDRRLSKRIRTTDEQGVHKGKRVSMAPPPNPRNNGGGEAESEEQKKVKEREAMRKKLEINKARRRSSRGRVSVGGKGAIAPKAKASRFGFISSAKSMVRSVLNMGSTGHKVTTAATSNIPVVKVSKPTDEKSVAPAPPRINSSGPKIPPSSNVPTAGSTSSKSLKPEALPPATSGSATSASRVRSPIPSFAAPPRPASSTATSRTSLQTGPSRARAGSGSSTVAPVRAGHSRTNSNTSLNGASMGVRTGAASQPSIAASSMGTRRTLGANKNSLNPIVSVDGQNGLADRKRASSLLSPTISSLAKQQGVRPATSSASMSLAHKRSAPLVAVAEQIASELGAIYSKSAAAATVPSSSRLPWSPRRSPRPRRIFSQPLNSEMPPSKPPTVPSSTEPAPAEDSATNPPAAPPKPAVAPRPKGHVARKPRISRSRVIARLGAQRAAKEKSAASSALSPTSRPRSSMGARRSLGGVKSSRTSGDTDMLMNAKRRARQSEYARRRSRAAASTEASSSLI